MNFKEELEKLGYVMSFSQSCSITAWGKWHVQFNKENGPRVAGYGNDETLALEDALKTARKIEENLPIIP